MGTDEIYLPKEMIHLIQSHMNRKEAARTSILSKSWYDAWLTRPDLDFDQRDFDWKRLIGRDTEAVFWQFVWKTTHRYDLSKLRIQSFRLCILDGRDNCSRAEKLIVRAINLGATDINCEVDGVRFGMFLPKEVLGSETLRRLSVRGCKIGLGVDRKAKCSRLESLNLKNVLYTDGDIFWDITLSCPLIENLSLSDCKFDIVDTRTTSTKFRKSSPFEKLSGSGVDGRLISPLNKLKRLFVEQVTIDTSFFHYLGSKFPCLKDLSIHNCDGYYGSIKIACSSLESVSFVQNLKMKKTMFDFPRIRKFMYQGNSLPSMSFKKYSRGWKSDISFTVHRYCALFPHLKKLLANLGKDEISLSLKILKFTDKTSDKFKDDGLPPVAVKDLILYLEVPSAISSSFLKGLFWSCSPKFLTLHFPPCGDKGNYNFFVLLFKTMVHLGLRSAEGPAEWRRAPSLNSFVNASLSPKFRGKIRMQLR